MTFFSSIARLFPAVGLGVFLHFAADSVFASSAPLAYHSRIWRVDDGLPQNSVYALAQTRDGYLWIGTQQGLARFDGVRFHMFNKESAPALPDDCITALCEGSNGSLWIATDRGGLGRWENNAFSWFTEQDGLGCGQGLRSLFESRDGALWIGTTNGLCCRRNGMFSHFTKEKNGLSGNIVRAICEDSQGQLWIATATGIDCLASGKVIRSLGATNGLLSYVGRALYCDGTGDLWIGVLGGVTRLRGDKLTHFTRNEGLADKTVTALFEDRRGAIWIGTYGGLNRLVDERLLADVAEDGQPFDTVNAIIEDREGNLWVGAKDGLLRLTPRRFTTLTKREGLTHNNVISVCEDTGGTIWAGTWGGGLNHFQDGAVRHFNSLSNIVNYSGSVDLVLGLHQDKQRRLWVGTDFNGGLFALMNEKFQRYAAREGLAGGAMKVIHEDRGGRLWVGTAVGLFLRGADQDEFRRIDAASGFAGEMVHVILEDSQGRLWIGTEGALNLERDEKFTALTTSHGLSSASIHALHEDKNGDLWVGTRGAGLNKLSTAKLNFQEKTSFAVRSYTMKQGLFRNDVFEILEDDAGFFWMTSRAGIFRVRQQDFSDLDAGKISSLACQSFGLADGLATVECNSVAKPAAIRARDGRLWFATAKGLAVTDPRLDLTPNEAAPPVVIEEVIADKKLISNFKYQTSNSIIPPGRGELEIHYTALSFSAPEKNQFKYRLEGFDPDWVQAKTRRVAYYNNLPPGDYTFRVVAANNDGVWNSLGANLKLFLQPHFWQRPWFRAFSSLLLLGGAGAAIRYFTLRRIRKRLETLEREHAIDQERSRIAQDMHDDLGARLTEITLLSDAAKNASSPALTKGFAVELSGISRSLVDSLDAIVWATDPRQDTLKSLAVYICEFAGRFLELSEIRFRVDVPGKLPAWPLPSAVRHNLFLVVRETLNNIVKHSAAREVRLHVRLDGDSLTLSIEDDGVGFSTMDMASAGNGLHNMQQRMENIGGSFILASGAGTGTRTDLQLRLKAAHTQSHASN